MKLLNKVYAIHGRIGLVGTVLAVILIYASMLIICIEVLIMRSLLDLTTVWVIEVTSFGLVFITFLSTSWLLKEDAHIKMDLVTSRLKPKARALMDMTTSIVGAILCLVLTVFGFIACLESFKGGTLSQESLRIPFYTLYVVIPLGFLLLTVGFIEKAHIYLRSWREASSKESG